MVNSVIDKLRKAILQLSILEFQKRKRVYLVIKVIIGIGDYLKLAVILHF